MILSYNKSKLPVKIARSRSRTPFIPKKNMLHCARPINCPCGGMVYTSDLKSDSRKGLRVRVPPRAPIGNSSVFWSPKCRLVRLWCVYFTKSEPIFKIGNVSHARSAWWLETESYARRKPRHRLASLGNPERKTLLAFLIWRG